MAPTTTRLGLEVLEDRTLLASDMPTHVPERTGDYSAHVRTQAAEVFERGASYTVLPADGKHVILRFEHAETLPQGTIAVTFLNGAMRETNVRQSPMILADANTPAFLVEPGDNVIPLDTAHPGAHHAIKPGSHTSGAHPHVGTDHGSANHSNIHAVDHVFAHGFSAGNHDAAHIAKDLLDHSSIAAIEIAHHHEQEKALHAMHPHAAGEEPDESDPFADQNKAEEPKGKKAPKTPDAEEGKPGEEKAPPADDEERTEVAVDG
jgi:hypothetical protein